MTLSPEELDKQIRMAKGPEPVARPPLSGGRLAATAGIEFISAVAVGGFLGYLVDRWLGTKPWGMVILFILGSAAGFVNIIRAASGQDYRVGMGTLKKDEKKEETE